MQTPTFNPEVYGTTGWAKFSVPMVGGTNPALIREYNTLCDAVVTFVKKNGGGSGANAALLSAFNVALYQAHGIGELIIDGKPTI